MTRIYYKTNDASALEAVDAYNKEANSIRAEGLKLAEYFGGKLLVNNSVYGFRVAGLQFDPPKSTVLWTVPDWQTSAGKQRPRKTIAKATPELKAELKQIQEKYNELFPKREADFNIVLSALGTDWGELLFSGLSYFLHDGYIYFGCSVKVADHMQEILASEYEAAKKAFEAKNGTN